MEVSLKELFSQAKRPILYEITPPKGVDLSSVDAIVDSIRGRISAYVVPEYPSAVMRMDPVFLAKYLEDKGERAVYEVTSAHRNSIAFQGTILGAYVFGLENILLSQGVNPKLGDHPQAKEVSDLDRDGMVEAVLSLRRGKDLTGHELDGSLDLYVGMRVHYRTVTEEAMTLELKKIEEWISKGVSFFITPIVFNERHYKPFSRKVREMGGRMVPSITLLKSAGMARFINRHIEGVEVPDVFINEIMRAPDKVKTACDIAKKVWDSIGDESDGMMIVPYGWDTKVPMLLDIL